MLKLWIFAQKRMEEKRENVEIKGIDDVEKLVESVDNYL